MRVGGGISFGQWDVDIPSDGAIVSVDKKIPSTLFVSGMTCKNPVLGQLPCYFHMQGIAQESKYRYNCTLYIGKSPSEKGDAVANFQIECPKTLD